MQSTRYYDKGKIEEDRDKGIISAKNAEKLLRQFREEEKNGIEEKRKVMIEKMKANDKLRERMKYDIGSFSSEEQKRIVNYFEKNVEQF